VMGRTKILPCETSQHPDLIMTAFTRALPKGSLYRHAEESEGANPKGHKKCFDHNGAGQFNRAVSTSAVRR
jgi:hypothetical protein